MKKIILCVVLFFITNFTFAVSEQYMNTCKLSANMSQHYAVFVDLKFRMLNEKKNSLPLEQIKSLIEKIQNEHEDFKDKRYKEFREYYDKKIQDRQISIRDAETEKMLLEAGIDLAYATAGQNYLNNYLNRPIEHYYRKIYDGCMGRY